MIISKIISYHLKLSVAIIRQASLCKKKVARGQKKIASSHSNFNQRRIHWSQLSLLLARFANWTYTKQIGKWAEKWVSREGEIWHSLDILFAKVKWASSELEASRKWFELSITVSHSKRKSSEPEVSWTWTNGCASGGRKQAGCHNNSDGKFLIYSISPIQFNSLRFVKFGEHSAELSFCELSLCGRKRNKTR